MTRNNLIKELEDKIVSLENKLKDREEALKKNIDTHFLISERIKAQEARLHEIIDAMKKHIVGDKVQLHFLKDLCKLFIDSMDIIDSLEASQGLCSDRTWR